jgi:mono/diheme cytochrome c family protein
LPLKDWRVRGIRRSIALMRTGTERALLGLGLALALACGGKVEAREAEPLSAAPAALPPFRGGGRPPRGTPAAPPPSVPMSPLPATPAPAMQPRVRPAADEPEGTAYQAKVTASYVLIANCGSCHGPAAPVESSGGIRFIDDLDQLVAAGLIVPSSSATSRIVIVMRDGSMPPPSSGLLPVTQSDLDIVSFYIDDPFYFPGVSPPAPAVVDAGVELPVGASDAGADPG